MIFYFKFYVKKINYFKIIFQIETEKLSERSHNLVTQLILFIGSIEITQTLSPNLLGDLEDNDIPSKSPAPYFLEKLLHIKGIVWGTPLLQVFFLLKNLINFFFLAIY